MRVYRSHLLAFVLTAVSLVSCSTDRAPTDAGLSTALHTAVDAKRPSFIADDGERGHQVWQEAQRFYRQNGYQLAWSNGTRARAPFDSLRSLGELAPSSPQYQGLKHQLARARSGGDAAAVQQIAMNMERWRWLPNDLGPRYLLVNIPAFRLDAIENGRSVLDMKVVTGKKDSPTPVLADQMTTVVFSPYWNIPQDIVQKEILPKVEKDPAYLEKNNIEAVKFLFPNHFNVYLHDTPSQALFERVERDFSHGCVRLDEPDKLAQYVLRDQPEWTLEKIAAAMQSGTEHAVKLKQPRPIYLVYFTAWEENGQLKTVPDVYGLDRRQDAAAKGQ